MGQQTVRVSVIRYETGRSLGRVNVDTIIAEQFACCEPCPLGLVQADRVLDNDQMSTLGVSGHDIVWLSWLSD